MPGCLTELRSAAATVAAADPAVLSPSALGDAVVELRQIIDALEGAWSGLVAALDGSGATDGGTAAWLRSACRLAPAAARSRVVLSRRLGDRAAVASALADGTISVDHARLVTTALAELAGVDPGLAVETEAPLLAAARRVDPARLRREIAHARHALVPAAAADADEQAYRRRHLDVATTFDGTVAVHGILDPEGGETLLVPLAGLSGRTRDDERTSGQRRADALVELCHRQLDRAELPALGGERPHLSVLVPLAALAPSATAAGATARPYAARAPIRPGAGTTTAAGSGAAVAPGSAGAASADPARLFGSSRSRGTAGNQTTAAAGRTAADLIAAETTWGAVLGSETARRLACDASITRVVLDPQGQPLDVGRRTRLIPPAIRTALVVRDRGCTHPGCDRDPQWTDAHHVQHWSDGGPTSLGNLVLLCRQHHRTVHEGRHATAHAPPHAA